MTDQRQRMGHRIPSVRTVPDNFEVLENLGLLKEFAGFWEGNGFNLVARPDHHDATNTFLELNLTHEETKFDPISSPIPNRGFLQEDITLYGLTYLQKIHDSTTHGALHIEPGIWINQPETSQPPLSPPAGGNLVTRMANIPHGNSLLAQGIATCFEGPPTISPGANPIGGGNPAFSIFPSFNSTAIDLAPGVGALDPGAVPLGAPIFSAGTSEAQAKGAVAFSEYNLANAASTTNTRTPLGDVPPILPPAITQELVNDPITMLQATVVDQLAQGYSFSGVAINISTAPAIAFFTEPVISGNPLPPTTIVELVQAGGGTQNLSFLTGTPLPGQTTPVPNAATVLVYATFWLEKLTHPTLPSKMQLQYAQMVILNFPAQFGPKPLFAWPHVSVATLSKIFG